VKILFASGRPPYPFFLGGAARCAHQLLGALSSRVECIAVGSGTYQVMPWSMPRLEDFGALGVRSARTENNRLVLDCGYQVLALQHFMPALRELIDSFKPDVVWAQLENALEILQLAKASKIQGLFYLHDAEFDPRELKEIGRMGNHVVCSSGFLARRAQQVIRRKAHAIYPCLDQRFGVTGDPHGYFTMINPHRVKGIDTFLAIAQRLPQQKFMLVESWRLADQALNDLSSRLSSIPNVRFVRRVSDMAEIYGQTKLLLVPSVWEEGFGMVACEAQSCRIPVIASARGGLPESVGSGGLLVSDYRNPDAWLRAINGVTETDDTYAQWCEQAYRHATSDKFKDTDAARRFHEVCSQSPDRGPFSAATGALMATVNAALALGARVRRAVR